MTSRTAQAVRVALLGTGAWAKVLMGAARESHLIDITSVWSRTPGSVQAFALSAGILACEGVEEIWEDRSIEAVIIALPNDQHYAYAKLAAHHGKHVFIEKPIAHTLDDGLRIESLEQTFHVRIAVGHCAQLLAGNRLMFDAIQRGDLGKVSQIEANFSNDRGLKLTPNDWRWYKSGAPGGPLSQIAIHQFDVLRALGGNIESVSARCATHSPVGAEVDDQWFVTCKFVDGKLGNVVSSWTSPGTYSVRVTGDKALMYYEIDQGRWSDARRLHEGATLYRQEHGQAAEARVMLSVPQGNMFCEELEMFADSIRQGQVPQLSCANACQALAAVGAAQVSAAREGKLTTLAEIVENARVRVAKSTP